MSFDSTKFANRDIRRMGLLARPQVRFGRARRPVLRSGLQEASRICVGRLATVAVLVVMLSATQATNADTLLRWKFVEGNNWQVNIEQHTTTETTGAGKPTGIDIAMQFQMNWKIDSVDSNGTARINQQIERFFVSMKSGKAEPITYDSASENKPSSPAANIAEAVAPVIGVDFEVVMTDRGSITEVKLSDAATTAFESISSPAMKQLFSKEGITQLLQQAAIEFPEQNIAAGDDWQQSLSTDSPLGKLNQAKTFTLTGKAESDMQSLEHISIAGTLKLEPTEQSPAKLKLVEQDLIGSMSFDVNAGRLVSSDSTQTLTTERPYREFKIKVKTTAKSTVAITVK